MPVANDKGFLEWVQFLKVYERDMSDTWKLPTSSLDIIYKFLSTGIRAESLDQIKDKKLFVMGEGGYGDFIWFYRYLSELSTLCELTLFCPKEIEPLMQDINTTTEFPERMSQKYDCWIWMFDLLRMMDSFGSTDRYIQVPEKKMLSDRKEGIIRVGFALGNSGGLNQMKYRNISQEIISYLVKDNIEAYNFSNISNTFCTNLFNKFDNFETTAQYIEEMDLIITSDNCLLHLSGALGKKTIAIFTQKHEPMWFGLPDKVLWYDSVTPIVFYPEETTENIANKLTKLLINQTGDFKEKVGK